MEIAIGILRADPKEDVTPARGWALDIIEKNSGVPFSQQDREALLRKPLSAKVALLGYGEYSEEVERDLKSVWAKLEERRSVGEQKRSPFTSP